MAIELSYTDLVRHAARFLNWDRDSGNWSANETADMTDIINSGLRMFYYPPPMPGERASHAWSFLKPVRTFSFWAEVDGTTDGVPDYDEETGKTTITATEAIFPENCEGRTIAFTESEAEYAIYSRTSSLIVVVTGDASAEEDTDFTIDPDGTYTLPSDVVDIVGNFWRNSTTAKFPIRHVSLGDVLAARSALSWPQSGEPTLFATRTTTLDATQQSRLEVVFDRESDADVDYIYQCAVSPDTISSTNTYVYGGREHSETILEAILASAEKMINDGYGVHKQAFDERLLASVTFDRTNNMPDTFGYAGERPLFYDPNRRFSGVVSYNGIVPGE